MNLTISVYMDNNAWRRVFAPLRRWNILLIVLSVLLLLLATAALISFFGWSHMPEEWKAYLPDGWQSSVPEEVSALLPEAWKSRPTCVWLVSGSCLLCGLVTILAGMLPVAILKVRARRRVLADIDRIIQSLLLALSATLEDWAQEARPESRAKDFSGAVGAPLSPRYIEQVREYVGRQTHSDSNADETLQALLSQVRREEPVEKLSDASHVGPFLLAMVLATMGLWDVAILAGAVLLICVFLTIMNRANR